MSDEKMVDLSPEEIRARERAVAEDVAQRNAAAQADAVDAAVVKDGSVKDKPRFSTLDK